MKQVLLPILLKFWEDNYPPIPLVLTALYLLTRNKEKKGASLISTLSCWSVRSFDLFSPPNFVCSSRAVGGYENRVGGGLMW